MHTPAYSYERAWAHTRAHCLTHTMTGFFIFETRDSLNMLFAHGIMEDILIVHHMLGVLLYCLTFLTRSYLYVACIVLVEVRAGVLHPHAAHAACRPCSPCFPAPFLSCLPAPACPPLLARPCLPLLLAAPACRPRMGLVV